MNTQEFKELIAKHSNDSLAEQDDMVYQVWEDGEVTLQKSGELLWQRNLHCIEYGATAKAVSTELFPHQHNNHGYAFVSKEGAIEISTAIKGYCYMT